MIKPPKTLIFLGPQGSGKGTQARLLAEKFGYRLIEAGELLRTIAKENNELGRKVKMTIDAGNLVEPWLITDVIKKRLSELSSDEAVIIDGYPRTVKQFELFQKLVSESGREDYLTLYFDITDFEALKRLGLRAEKEGRADDTKEAIKKRLSWSRGEVDPVVSKMEGAGKLSRIDGMPSIEEIHREVLERLGL